MKYRTDGSEEMQKPQNPKWVPMSATRTAERHTKSQRAEIARRNAGVERRLAQCGGSEGAARLKDAERLEHVAVALMKPAAAPVVKCGEVTRVFGEIGPNREIVNTLDNPGQAAIDASISRTDLLASAPADIVALAVDAAASAKADNSLMKMLAHQLALIHTLAMKTGSRALEFEKRQGVLDEGFKQTDSVELARLAQATGRLTSTFQDGLLTLQRMRNGGSQTMTIRHVNDHAGGQALIGNVKPGGRRGSKLGRGKPK
jgi:hypothetical protein